MTNNIGDNNNNDNNKNNNNNSIILQPSKANNSAQLTLVYTLDFRMGMLTKVMFIKKYVRLIIIWEKNMGDSTRGF